MSAPLSGGVVVKGGILSSGDNVTKFQTETGLPSGPVVTAGSIAGALTVDSGGIVSPGGASGSGLVGTLSAASVTANAGSFFDFTLAGGDSATNSQLISSGALTLDTSGAETVKVLGDQLALGTYTLATYSSLMGTGTPTFSLGTTPNGPGRSYSLTTGASDLLLVITATGTERYWSTNGGTSPQDGSGNWLPGTTEFYDDVPPPGTSGPGAYQNAVTADAVFGNGGSGGTVTITGSVSVGGGAHFLQCCLTLHHRVRRCR